MKMKEINEQEEDQIFCPWCGAVELDTEVEKIDELHYRIHFICNTCGMKWTGPKEKEKRYQNGKKPDERVINYWIKKKLNQEYVDKSSQKNKGDWCNL